MALNTCCCTPGGINCHRKQIIINKTKWGEAPFTAIPDDPRRYLTHTTIVTWSDGQYGGSIVSQQDRLTGVITNTGSVPSRPGVPVGTPNAADTLTATDYIWHQQYGPLYGNLVLTVEQTLTDEYTDAMVYADAQHMFELFGGTTDPIAKWDPCPLDYALTLDYNVSGNVIATPSGAQPVIGPIPCLFPAGAEQGFSTDTSTQFGSASITAPADGHQALVLILSRLYLKSTACILTRFQADQPNLPVIADTCAEGSSSGTPDSTGFPYFDVLPPNIRRITDDDPRFYAVDMEVMAPDNAMASPLASDGSPWGCVCEQNLAP